MRVANEPCGASEHTRRSKKVVVYELYGLTDDEIEIVEEAVGE